MVERRVTRAMDPRPVGGCAGHTRCRGGVGEGVASQRQADDHRDRAGDGGGQYLLHRAVAAEADDEARCDGHKARKHDAELCLRNQFRRQYLRGFKLCKLFRRALGGHHAGNRRQVGEAGAVIEGDLLAGDDDEEQRRQAAGKDGGGHLETGDDRHRHRRREHDDDLLQGIKDKFSQGWPLFRQVAKGSVMRSFHLKHALFLDLCAAYAQKCAPGRHALPRRVFSIKPHTRPLVK